MVSKTKQKYEAKRITVCLMTLSIGKIRGRGWWINEYGKQVEWHWERKTDVIRDRHVPVPLCYKQPPHMKCPLVEPEHLWWHTR